MNYFSSDPRYDFEAELAAAPESGERRPGLAYGTGKPAKLRLVGKSISAVPTLKELQRHARLFGPGQVLETAADYLDARDFRDLGDYLDELKRDMPNPHWRGRAVKTARYRVRAEAILDARPRMDKGTEGGAKPEHGSSAGCEFCGAPIALAGKRRRYCSQFCRERAKRARRAA